MSYLCSICGSGDHSASRCKELALPPDGFYKAAPASASYSSESSEEGTLAADESLAALRDKLKSAE